MQEGGKYNMEEKTLLAENKKEQKKQIEEGYLAQKENYQKEVESQPENQTQPQAPRQTYQIKQQNQTTVGGQDEKSTKSRSRAKPFYVVEDKDDPLIRRIDEKHASIHNLAKEVESQEAVQSQPQASNSLIIEKPNYDFIETLSPEQRERIFTEEKPEEEAKPKANKFKVILFSILFAIFGIWGIINITTLDSLGSQISDITTEYNMNLISYLNNLHNLDATNSQNMENLFQTIPTDPLPPNSIDEQSNWFDRFCNFIAGLFGG